MIFNIQYPPNNFCDYLKKITDFPSKQSFPAAFSLLSLFLIQSLLKSRERFPLTLINSRSGLYSLAIQILSLTCI